MVSEMESSVQEVPSEPSMHGSIQEDMSDSMSQTSSLAGEDRPGTSSLAFGGGSAYKKRRGPLSKFVHPSLCAFSNLDLILCRSQSDQGHTQLYNHQCVSYITAN